MSGDSFNYTISLGSVNGSYDSNVEIPVEILNGTDFRNLTQTFSYNFSILKFDGVVNDLSSGNVSFSWQNLTNGIVRVVGIGPFIIPFSSTVLYYLNFTPIIKNDIKFNVLLDGSTIGGKQYLFQSTSTVELT